MMIEGNDYWTISFSYSPQIELVMMIEGNDYWFGQLALAIPRRSRWSEACVTLSQLREDWQRQVRDVIEGKIK